MASSAAVQFSLGGWRMWILLVVLGLTPGKTWPLDWFRDEICRSKRLEFVGDVAVR